MSKFTFKGEGRGLTKTLLSLDFEQVHFPGRERDDHTGCTYILSIVLDLAFSWEGLGIIGSCVLEEKETSQ